MAQRQKVTVTFRDAHIIWPNFKGEKQKYNNEGDRNFNLELTPEEAMDLERNGWNVKLKKRNSDEEYEDAETWTLKVSVNFDNYPPRVWLVSNIDPDTGIGMSRTMLNRDAVGLLDDLEPMKIDLVITAYDWEVNGKSGRKAFLQSMFYTMYEDELEREYAGVQQISAIGDSAPKELESGARMAYDFEGEVEH